MLRLYKNLAHRTLNALGRDPSIKGEAHIRNGYPSVFGSRSRFSITWTQPDQIANLQTNSGTKGK